MQCRECRFYDVGQCKRYPAARYDERGGIWEWPRVKKGDWCGEFKGQEVVAKKEPDKEWVLTQPKVVMRGSVRVRDRRPKAKATDTVSYEFDQYPVGTPIRFGKDHPGYLGGSNGRPKVVRAAETHAKRRGTRVSVEEEWGGDIVVTFWDE